MKVRLDLMEQAISPDKDKKTVQRQEERLERSVRNRKAKNSMRCQMVYMKHRTPRKGGMCDLI